MATSVFGNEGLAPVNYEGNILYIDTEGDRVLETDLNNLVKQVKNYLRVCQVIGVNIPNMTCRNRKFIFPNK